LLAGLPENAPPGAMLPSIRGQVPNMASPPAGCAFRDRCDRADNVCLARPPLRDLREPGRKAACWHVLDGEPV
jgi:peptide/nickel transport system ATP-binding protein